MNYMLNRLAIFSLTENGLIISVPGIGFKVMVEGINEYLRFVDVFNYPISYKDAYIILNQANDVSEKHFEEMFSFSNENNILKKSFEYIEDDKEFTNYHLEKYSRQIRSFLSLPGMDFEKAVEIQKKIQKSKIIIIGLGGTGSHLALSLAMIGVEHLVIVDNDIVELSNTSRQILYDESNLGEKKLSVAEKKLKKYNKNLKIDKYECLIKKPTDLQFLYDHKDADLLVLCADTPRGEIEYFIDEISKEISIPWLSYGPFHHSKISIGPLFIPKITKSYSELFSPNMVKKDLRTEKINKNFYSAILDPFNGLASKIAVIEILKFLTDYATVSVLEKKIVIDTDNWEIKKVNL